MRKKQKIIVILGPTAAGKTKLGVALAYHFNGEIVSADSRQVYKYLDISTGKDLKDYSYENKNIPHHLIDIIEPSQTFSVADFQKKAYQAIEDILKRKKLPIIVGGSPFYLYSIIEGWNFQKTTDKKIREKLEKLNLNQLKTLLKKTDIDAYKKIDLDNPRRVQRAIEVCLVTGKSFKESKPKPNPKYEVLVLGIKFPLEMLKERIKNRLTERIGEGMIEEIENIVNQEKATWKNMDDLGLEPRYISQYLRKKISQKEMKELLIKNIYLFARRQMNWFRKDKNIIWLKDIEKAKNKVEQFLKS